MKNNAFLGFSAEGFHKIAYTEWGQANASLPGVICVHGYSRNGRDFDALAAYLESRGRHVFCPDVPGRGDSDWFVNPQYYNLNQYANDMAALIARTQYQQVDWIGTSMGGLIGLMLAAQPNSPIRLLVMNDVGPQVPVFGLKKLNLSSRQYQFDNFEKAKHYFQTQCAEFGQLTDDQWQTFTEHSVRKTESNSYQSKLDPNVKNARSAWQFINDFVHHPHKSLEGLFYDIDLWSLWKKVQCPVLVIRGEKSDLLTPEIVRKMKRLHSSTDLYEKPNAGHAPALLDEVDHQSIHQWLDTAFRRDSGN